MSENSQLRVLSQDKSKCANTNINRKRTAEMKTQNANLPQKMLYIAVLK